MRVKICGLTRAEDARMAQELGAWALGFIFYPRSKRYITPAAAKPVIASLPAAAQPIGVFVNQTLEAVAVGNDLVLKGLQLHGDETPDECKRVRDNFGGLLIKALRPEKESDLEAIAAYKGIADYILLDAAVAGQYGGTGQTGDWSLAGKAKTYGIPVILAGGIGPENIQSAMAAHPFACDLAGGVEASPGVKDPEKLKALFGALKGMAA
ncbi:MAG: phosphoribosylanthranilate isomerase [Alphaproteobacteria bacterium]